MFFRRRKRISDEELTEKIKKEYYNIRLKLYEAILERSNAFTYSNVPLGRIPSIIGNRLEVAHSSVTIKTKWYWRKKVLAWYKGGDVIYFNSRCLNRPLCSLVGTYAHELTHVADSYTKEYFFGHGDNSPKGKEESAPYWIGRVASRVAKWACEKEGNK